jgi:predicted secreted protein
MDFEVFMLRKNISTLRAGLFLIALVSFPAFSAPSSLVELSAEASRPAANDLVRATVAAEDTGSSTGAVSKQVNGQISLALKAAKDFPAVKTRSGASFTYPVYAKGGKIEAWRMKSELMLESSDMEAISALLGRLQGSLSVANFSPVPAPETRKKSETEAMLDALTAFQARAKIIAAALGKTYRIKQLSVNTNASISQPMYKASARTMMAEAAPMPMELGESQVTVVVSGQIELE